MLEELIGKFLIFLGLSKGSGLNLSLRKKKKSVPLFWENQHLGK